jgi:DNA polymerase III subunit beta
MSTATATFFVANRKALLSALQTVASVAPTRSPKPIIQNYKLAVTDDGAEVMATDLEIGIRCRVLGVRSDVPGDLILSPKVVQILAASTSDDVIIQADDAGLTILAGRSRYQLPSEDPDLFPEVPTFDAEEYHAIASKDLRRLIKRTSYATDVESTRYALGGVLFEVGAETLSCVATDARRLAKMSAAIIQVGSPKFDLSTPVVPVKALKLIERNLADDDTPVHFSLTPQAATFRTDKATIHTRLVEGRFPRYQDVFPKDQPSRVTVNAGAFLGAVGQASIVTSDESRGVDFNFANGLLELASKAADVGASTVEFPIEYDGPKVLICFDPRYVSDMLRSVPETMDVTIELIDHKNAAVIKTDDGLQVVLMPLTRER